MTPLQMLFSAADSAALDAFETARARYIAAGMDPDEAADWAADVASDTYDAAVRQ